MADCNEDGNGLSCCQPNLDVGRFNKGKNMIRSKWVFIVKEKVGTNLYNTHLGAKGCSQKIRY